MREIQRARLRARMEEKGFNARSLAVACEFGPTFISDFLTGKKDLIRHSGWQKIADVLDCSIEYLHGLSNSPDGVHLASDQVIAVSDTIKAGIWREEGATVAPKGAAVVAPPNSHYPASSLRAYLVDDDHAAGLGIMPGTIVTSVEPPDRQPRHGDVVIVRRSMGGTIFELTIRVVAGEFLVGEPETQFVHPVRMAEAEIVGRVIALTRVFD